MTRFHPLLVTFMVLVFLAPPTSAQSENRQSDTEKALEQLRIALEQDQDLSPATRKAFRDFAAAMQAELAGEREAFEVPAAATPPTHEPIQRVVDERLDERFRNDEKPAWEQALERLNIYGDLRLRHESSFNLDDTRDRNRQRLRFRMRLDYQLSDELLLGGGIRTGDPNDPNSAYITLGNGFDDFDISLDRALVTYRPNELDGLWVTAGKFTNPVRRNPVYGELVWDADVNPEGIVGGYTFPGIGPLDKIDLLVGGYTVLEDASTDDVFALALQLSGHLNLSEHLESTIAVGYYLYGDTTPDGNLALLDDNSGNAVVDRDGDGTADDFVSDFSILNPIIAFNYDGWNIPLTIAGEYILNTRAHGGNDQGWAFGASLGQAKKKGDWRFYYQWQVVEQDAVFSPFAQDDFLFQTNFRGHVFGTNYQLADNIGLNLWGLVSARDTTFPGLTTDSDKDQWRLRADLTIKF